MKRDNIALNKVKISGGNSINFINNCVNCGLKLRNIDRTTSRDFTFEINDRDYKQLITLDNRGCNITIDKVGGKKRLINNLIYRIGLVIGIIISLIGVILFNNRLIQVHILGLTRTSEEMVLSSLEELGVTKFSYMSFDTGKLEQELTEEFNFSLVSIMIKGNSLIVNIKEELPSLENSYAPITADYNMVINSIKVYAGTSKVKEGDIVYRGDTLVEPFIKKGEDIVYIVPTAEIEATLFFSNSYVFKNSEEVYARTGEKDIVCSQINLGVFKISYREKSTSYNEYEEENKISSASFYFLPIIINKRYAYELEKKTITRDFDKEKDNIIDTQKKSLYNTIPENLKIESEEIKVTSITNGYIINVYLTSKVQLKYS